MKPAIPLAAVLLLLVATATSCSSPSKFGCDSDAQCRDGRICVNEKCQRPGGGANNADPNNVGENNADNADNTAVNDDPNVLPNQQPNQQPNNLTPNNDVSPSLALCREFCDLLLGSCVDEACMLSAEVRAALDELVDVCIYDGFEEDEPGCLDALSQNPDLASELNRFVETTACTGPELHAFRCAELDLGPACGCDPTEFPDVGDECTGPQDCDGGGLPGICLDETNEPPFPGGYCASIGCPVDANDPQASFDPICGVGNVCAPAGDAGTTGVCVDGCEQQSDCRRGYQCRLMGATPEDFRPIRVCLPECSAATPCENPVERCADGVCQIPCTDPMDPNEPGGRQICEILGFECSPDDAGVEWCVMP